MEKALAENSEEITPYKILPAAIEEIKKATERRMRLFGRILDK